MRVLVIDNYDSFTWNLVHYLSELGGDVTVVRNDAPGAEEAILEADAVVISPGPGDPDGAGVSLPVVAACAAARRPLLGVCLGHQAIAQAFGGRIARADRVMHGKTSVVAHGSGGLFDGVPSPMQVARYHSLAVTTEGLPSPLRVTATAEDGTIMALTHRVLPIHGVQFHPESIATEHGHRLLSNFLRLAAAENESA
ncbi:MAG TPA: aminodeoxychorismate/anthranilate synthase component II [Sphingomonadaceae bacterium]|nr:aminodeoxychorismate/anthranilate synthase component II [Sphingomonadaceae bacterium]